MDRQTDRDIEIYIYIYIYIYREREREREIYREKYIFSKHDFSIELSTFNIKDVFHLGN